MPLNHGSDDNDMFGFSLRLTVTAKRPFAYLVSSDSISLCKKSVIIAHQNALGCVIIRLAYGPWPHLFLQSRSATSPFGLFGI